jgi:hypothetical protein
MTCEVCRDGLNIPETEPIYEDKHGKHRVCPACGGSANIPGEPFIDNEDDEEETA